MALLVWHAVLSLSVGSCLFLDEHCYLLDSRRITCLLQGDSEPNEPRLDSILAQTLATEAAGQKGCPQMALSSNQIIELYLLPCEGMFDTVRGHMDDFLDAQGNLQHSHITDDYYAATCNQSKFTVHHALFDDFATTKFRGGIHLKSTIEVDYEKHAYNFRPVIQRAAGSFPNDGTCNVINNGMHDVGLQGLELNNQPCVDAEVPPSEMAGALKKFGPDTM